MQYEKYELKIQKIEKFFKFIFRHLGKIITVCSLILAATVGLLAARGTLTASGDGQPMEVFYGETVRYEAKAFLSDVAYEYAPSGTEEWSAAVPLLPGDYQVRAVAKATFGYRYGDPTAFTIKKKPMNVSIASAGVIYGSEPSVTSADLVYADQIASASFTYNEDRSHAEIASVVIRDENGADITSRYEISMTGRDIYTEPRPVRIAIEGASKIYDGTPLVSNQYAMTEGTLAEGDRMELLFEGMQTEVGRVRNAATYQMFNEAGEDVTQYYEITETVGYLEVLTRDIAIKTDDLTVTYDAQIHTEQGYRTTGALSLAAGHTLQVDGWAEITNAGTVRNTFSDYQVLDAVGNDVTDNYSIACEWGSLTVNPRVVTLVTSSGNQMYNGTALSVQGYALQSMLAEGHELIVDSTTYPSITNAGSIQNKPSFVIVDQGGNDVTANYMSDDTAWGTLEIQPIPVKIQLGGGTKSYDGAELTNASWDYAQDSPNTFSTGHTLVILDSTGITNVGRVTNAVTDYCIEGTETENYDIEFLGAELEVTLCDYTLTTASKTWIYDGTAHSLTDYIADAVTANGHRIVVTRSAEVIDYSEEATFNVFFEYDILDAQGQSVKENYHHTGEPDWGELKIQKRSLTLTTFGYSGTYDGVDHKIERFDRVEGLANGHEVVPTDFTSIKTVVTDAENVIEFEIKCGNETIDKNNYDIHTEWGNITVSPLVITVKTASANKIYDGTPLMANSWVDVVSNKNLVAQTGHRIDGPQLTVSITNAGRADNHYEGSLHSQDFQIFDGNENVTANYVVQIIDDAWGTLTVEKRAFVFVTGSATKEYDGTPLQKLTWNYGTNHPDQRLLAGHEVVFLNPSTITDVGDTYNFLFDPDTYIIVDRNNGDLDVTGNYTTAGGTVGTLRIIPRKITVTTGSGSWVYDGEAHFVSTYTIGGSGLAPNQTEKIETLASMIINVGTRNNVLDKDDIQFFDAENNPVNAANYEITVVEGILEVTKRPVVIISNSSEKIYDGTPLQNTTWSYVATTPYELVNGHKIEVVMSTAINDVADKEDNIIEAYRFVDAENQSVAANYDLEIRNGTLTVTKRPITLIPNDIQDFIYDGTDHAYLSQLTATNFPSIHELAYVSITEIKNVKRDANGNVIAITNEMAFTIFDRNTREEISLNNYEIAPIVWDTVTITKRPLKIGSNSRTHEYDGNPFVDDEILFLDGTALCQNDFIPQWSKGTESFINVSDSGANIITFVILDQAGEDVTDNYEITYDWGTITITPRYVEVMTGSQSWRYDGEEHTCYDIVPAPGYSLVSGHTLYVAQGTLPIIRDAATQKENKFLYDVVKIMVDGTEAENYNIKLVGYGTLTVTQEIRMYLYRQTLEYDGKEKQIKSYALLDDLPDDYEFTLLSVKINPIVNKNLWRVGEILASDLTVYFLMEKDGEDLSKLYHVVLEEPATQERNYTVLIITPRTIVIATASATRPANGETLFSEKWGYSFGSLADGDEITFAFETAGRPKNKGESCKNNIDGASLKIYRSDNPSEILYSVDNPNANCYIITVSEGDLKVT